MVPKIVVYITGARLSVKSTYGDLVECRSAEPSFGIGVHGYGERYGGNVATGSHAPQQDD